MKTIYALLFTLLPFLGLTQSMESGDIVLKINGIISSLPGEETDVYMPPGAGDRTDWEAMLVNLFAGNYATAAMEATALDYDLIEFSDNTNATTYYVLERASGSTNYWGTYVYNPTACREEVIIQSPHPRKDFNTGKQGIYVFKTIDAGFYMLSGTNRCNSLSTSSCDGMTSVCNDMDVSEDYRISDLAHVTDAIWQTTTTYIHDNIVGTYFVQLHGFGKQVSDPYLILSNGTRDTPMPDYLSDLATQLAAVDGCLTSKIAHIDLAWDRLIGFTNTQGRYINSSTDPCDDNATMTNGRFLHVEQEKTKLRNDSTGWHKMAIALSKVFSEMECGAVAALLPVGLTKFSAKTDGAIVQVRWTTAWEEENASFQIERANNGIFEQIGEVKGQGTSIETHDYLFEDQPEAGQYLYRLRQIDLDGQFSFSPIRAVEVKGTQTRIWVNQDQLFVENTSVTSNTEIQLFNASGQLQLHSRLNQIPIDVSNFPKGIYFFLINEGGKKISGKLIF